MSPPDRSRDKRVVFESLLERGIAALHLDARLEGVQVPFSLRRRPWLVLNFSHSYRLDDFVHDDVDVCATLSFGGEPFGCRIPWTAIFAITNEARDAGYAWSDEMPEHLASAMARAQDGTPSPLANVADIQPSALETPADDEATTDGLRLVDGGAAPTTSAPRRGHLRRIK